MKFKKFIFTASVLCSGFIFSPAKVNAVEYFTQNDDISAEAKNSLEVTEMNLQSEELSVSFQEISVDSDQVSKKQDEVLKERNNILFTYNESENKLYLTYSDNLSKAITKQMVKKIINENVESSLENGDLNTAIIIATTNLGDYLMESSLFNNTYDYDADNQEKQAEKSKIEEARKAQENLTVIIIIVLITLFIILFILLFVVRKNSFIHKKLTAKSRDKLIQRYKEELEALKQDKELLSELDYYKFLNVYKEFNLENKYYSIQNDFIERINLTILKDLETKETSEIELKNVEWVFTELLKKNNHIYNKFMLNTARKLIHQDKDFAKYEYSLLKLPKAFTLFSRIDFNKDKFKIYLDEQEKVLHDTLNVRIDSVMKMVNKTLGLIKFKISDDFKKEIYTNFKKEVHKRYAEQINLSEEELVNFYETNLLAFLKDYRFEHNLKDESDKNKLWLEENVDIKTLVLASDEVIKRYLDKLDFYED